MADRDRTLEGARMRDGELPVGSDVTLLRTVSSFVGRPLAPLTTLAVGLGCWQAFVVLFDVPTVVLPSPADVAVTLAATYPVLLSSAVVTALTAAGGLLVGTGVGLTLAFSMTVSRASAKLLLPYVVALRIAPLIAIAPLLFLWLGRGIPARSLLVATLTVFPITVATLDGLRSTPPLYLALARSVAAPPHVVFLRVRVPAATGSVFAGLKIASTLAVIGAVVAEFVTLRAGLGYRVFTTATNLQTAESYAALVILAGLGIAFYLVPVILERVVRSS